MSTSTGSPVFDLSGLIFNSLAIIVGYFDVGELSVRFEIEAHSRYRHTGGTFVELRVEGFRDDFEGDHFSDSRFRFCVPRLVGSSTGKLR